MHGSISNEVVKNLNKLTYQRQIRKLKTAFNKLSTNHKDEYIEYVKAKPKNSTAIASILNVLEKEEKLKIFKELLQKDKESAFNTLYVISPEEALFKILFGQLNIQQKEDYRVHLKTKSTFKAKYTLREFYLNNKESVNNLSTENSNEPLVQNRDDLPAAHFSPIPHAFEETVVKYPFDTRPELSSDKEDQLCSQIVPPFEGFAEFHNQFSNIVKEDSTVNDSSVPEEHTSLEGELTFLDSQINGGEPLTSLQSSNVNPLPEFSFSLSSVTLDEMVKRYGFNHNDHALSDLEEVYVEQPAKFHTYYHN
uniref:Ankyrin repeat domain protein n=1 Tax=Wolbachia endosymbiont of Oeneis ivallda TaxID=3171168 RepID=A0AAU7YKS3_9RICK